MKFSILIIIASIGTAAYADTPTDIFGRSKDGNYFFIVMDSAERIDAKETNSWTPTIFITDNLKNSYQKELPKNCTVTMPLFSPGEEYSRIECKTNNKTPLNGVVYEKSKGRNIKHGTIFMCIKGCTTHVPVYLEHLLGSGDPYD